MLAAGFAPGAALDGDDDDRIDDGFRFFCGAHRLLVVDSADGVAAVGNQDDDFSSLAMIERARGQINRIVERGGCADADMVNALVDAPEIGSIATSGFVHHFAEAIHESASTGRRMACAKRLAEACSSGRS